jgi:hypothetical protein
MLARVAERVFPTMLEPLRPREELRRLIGDELAWRALFEEPLAVLLERGFESDLLRGVVCTDATIGTFATDIGSRRVMCSQTWPPASCRDCSTKPRRLRLRRAPS